VLLTNATICDENFNCVSADIELDCEYIAKVEPHLSGTKNRLDLTGLTVLPGFIDLHIHGCAGADTCDGTPEALDKMSIYLASKGVTSFCPTTMTVSPDELERVLQNVNNVMVRGTKGARILGVHMEGPYISPEKCGVHNADFIKKPDIDEFLQLVSEYPGLIKIIDVAPECDTSEEFIEKAGKICTVSFSHSAADYDAAMKSFDRGITHVTHLFNAMSGINHRSPGAASAVLDHPDVHAELICDKLHIHPAVLRLAFKVLGENRTIIISDAMRAAGEPDGNYLLGGQKVTVMNKRTSFADGRMAGSTTDIYSEVKNLIGIGVPWRQVIKSATINPALQLKAGSLVGSIRAGKMADLLIVDENMAICMVIINGRIFSSSMA
jgi:N-acetylglucosamine-6-phosphate deacetylase